MKHISSQLQDHLSGHATTLTWCWSIERRDGVRLGFTEHNDDVVVDDFVYRASGVVDLAEMSASTGLSRDPLEVFGALKSDALDNSDIEAGLYDNGKVEIWLVNWSDPTESVLYRTCTIGEISYTAQGYVAQILPLSAKLDGPQGRTFLARCDAELGDERCGVDLELADNKASAHVISTSGSHGVILSVAPQSAPERFINGILSVTSGGAAGFSAKIKNIGVIAVGGLQISTWTELPGPVTAGDTVSLIVGCDKSVETCASRFTNIENFRGFPFMPGNDFVTSYPSRFDRDASA
ncbi:MAG: DUF2163 domain-containing protein [Pseudomonadota bacterium]